ncbi:hypothetical protein BCR32DRAFT_271724 [Anaeromyces robustus]|uniref:Uncharacterized protein n=1 Tax=Anaeromyces robustus TaxID=1754192 RepID=A0A1Y1WQB2_9FUNG|nr:hypothetical protein BCR32DRAFT_271724 [Anaeromyces robustus]|eukprot:ORX75721.1 hypothetical protein BCR32DRAFT_271724 [Anaeromyces robustus]
MRKKEHISNCEIAKKIIPFYNSYNYAGLRSKGNRYTHDDFCVSDSEYDEELSNESNEECINLNEHDENSEVEIIQNSSLENTLNKKKSKKNKKKEKQTKKRRKNVILESSYESDDNTNIEKNIINNHNNKNKSYDKKESYNIVNDENYYNDDINSDLEIFSSSPVLPSVDSCMENLLNNTPKAKDKEHISCTNNDFLIDEDLIGNNNILNKNNNNDYNNISSIIKEFNNGMNDPLSLFSNEINDSLNKHSPKMYKKHKNISNEISDTSNKHSPKIHNKYNDNSNEISNSKLKNKSIILDDFEIDENLIGNKNNSNEISDASNKYSPKIHKKYNDNSNEITNSKLKNKSIILDDFEIDENLIGNKNNSNEIIDASNKYSPKIHKKYNDNSNEITNSKLKNKSIIFDDFEIDENLIGNKNHISKQKQKNKEKDTNNKVKELIDLFSNDNINNTLDNASTSCQTKNDSNLDGSISSQNFHIENNVIHQTENSNNELNELYDLFTNDIKDSINIESDEEFIMSSNNNSSHINNKLNVKNLYSISNDNNDSLELIINNDINIDSKCNTIDKKKGKNNEKYFLNNDDKIKAENELLQLFNDENEEAESTNDIINSESDDDIFSSQKNKKKYFKQTSIKNIINNEKEKEKEMDDKINEKILSQFDNKKEKEEEGSTSFITFNNHNKDNISNYIEISYNNQEKLSSINQNNPRKNKLDFYFKQLPLSSTSSSTSELPSSSSNNEPLYPNKISYYNITKNKKKRANEDNYNSFNPTKNPFIVSKKQKTEVNFKNNDEHNSLNNVLLKFESNEKPKISSINSISKRKQKKQVSLLSLFSSQNENKKDKSPDIDFIIDSVIKPKAKKNKNNHHYINKTSSLKNNTKIHLRTSKKSNTDDGNYIEPLIYILTSDKKENYNLSNTNSTLIKPKTKVLHQKNNIIFSCLQIKNPIHQSRHNSIYNNEIGNSSSKNLIERNINLNDNYDLMKNHITKKKHENNLVDSFIDSFINKQNKNDSNKEKSITWPKTGWNAFVNIF